MKGEPGLPLGKHPAVCLTPSLINVLVAAIIYVPALKVGDIALTVTVISHTNNNNWIHFKTSFFDL
jgi:hypothetical protein